MTLDSREIYVSKRDAADAEALVDSFTGWLDFMRDQAKFSTDELASEALALEAAWEYLGGVYNDFHALHFHNLLRNDRFESRMPLVKAGLARLDEPEYSRTLAAALKVFQTNRQAWDVPRFVGGSEEYKRAQAMMKPADDAYCGLDRANDRRKLIADAILRLPTLRIVDEADLSQIRQQFLAASPVHAQEDAVEQGRRRAEEAANARRARTEKSLESVVAFAAEMLAEGAGFADVLTPPGERHVDEDGSTEMWFIMLRTKDRQAQMHRLIRSGGRFSLFDNNMATLKVSATEKDVERARQKLLQQVNPAVAAPSGFRRLFGRKGL